MCFNFKRGCVGGVVASAVAGNSAVVGADVGAAWAVAVVFLWCWCSCPLTSVPL